MDASVPQCPGMGGLTTGRRSRRYLGSVLCCATLLCAALLARPLWADLAIDLSIADIQGEQINVRGIQLALSQGADGTLQLNGQIAHLSLPTLAMEFTQLALDCPQVMVDAAGYHCEQATLSSVDGPVGEQQVTLALRYATADDWSFEFSGLRVAGGRLNGGFEGGLAGWRGSMQAKALQVRQLTRLRAAWSPPAGWSVDGRLDGDLTLAGVAGEVRHIQLALQGRDIGYADADGLQAAEGLHLQTRIKAQAAAGEWRGEGLVSLHHGQLYSDPVFVEVGKEAITLQTGFHTRDGLTDLQLMAAHLRWPAMLDAVIDGWLGLAVPAHRRLDMRLRMADLAAAYPVLLQPLMLGTALDDVSLEGGVKIHLGLGGEGVEVLEVKIDDLHLDDNQARFGVAGLTGDMHWRRAGAASPSALVIDSGHLYALDLGTIKADFVAQGDELQLSAPLVIPLLDGEARLQSLRLSGLLGEQGIAWQASADLANLSLSTLSQKLGWPMISGELNGHIPGLSYQQGVVRLGGELTAQALGGRISITNLVLRDPLGPVPVLEADASLHNLDLEQLTRAFSFGRITGLLDGEVRDLQLVGWQPSRFVARFYSPAYGEGPPRRISQRAVENLTELGNGVAVGLSGTFLRFFEDFAYDRIRLEVKLQGQNAELDGMPHSGGGFYLVRGRGLPRIDVVGRNRKVAWRDLVSRLKNIRFEGVQVKR